MSIQLIITFTAEPSKQAAFADILAQIKTSLPKVQGCKGVRVFNDIQNPNVFTLVETWDSQEQHKAHIDQVMASGAWTHIASHLTGDPVSSYYQEM
jgi:quinol monooxygenase YgiN